MRVSPGCVVFEELCFILTDSEEFESEYGEALFRFKMHNRI